MRGGPYVVDYRLPPNALSERMEGQANQFRETSLEFLADGHASIGIIMAQIGELFDTLAIEFRKPPFGP